MSKSLSSRSVTVKTQQTRPSMRAQISSIFSFPVMCVFLLGAAIFSYCQRGIAESDIWWHMRNASTLLQHHSFSRVDTYSFTAAGSPWINFEWLSEVPFYLAFRSIGLQGLLLVYFVVLTVIFAAVYYRCCDAGADCKDAVLATLGAICLGGVSMAPRTLLFGWLCMAGLLLTLDRFRKGGRGLWLLPLIFALWINFHASWVFGFAVLGATIIAGLFEGQWGQVAARRWTRSELRQLILASCASVAALFVNPFGYKLVLYPFDLLFRPQGVVQFIDEWQPVDFGTWNGKLSLMLIASLLGVVLFLKRGWRLDEVFLAAFALWAALSHVRFLFFAGLVIAPIIAPSLKFFPPYDRESDKPWLNAMIMATVVAGMFIFFPRQAQLQQNVDAEFPRAALDFMRSQNIRGNLFNQYGWGGYIEWNAPKYKTFIDGRADIFIYNGTFRDFLAATALNNSTEIMDKYKIDYILIPPKGPLNYFLQHSAGWQPIYSDDVAVLFRRKV